VAGLRAGARCVGALDRKVATLEECIREEVEASGTTLTELFGVGSILAAKIIGIVGDVGRFPNKEHFASSEEASLPSKLLAARCSGTGSRLGQPSPQPLSCT
jgi:transposase